MQIFLPEQSVQGLACKFTKARRSSIKTVYPQERLNNIKNFSFIVLLNTNPG
jgi:hypothetical protein